MMRVAMHRAAGLPSKPLLRTGALILATFWGGDVGAQGFGVEALADVNNAQPCEVATAINYTNCHAFVAYVKDGLLFYGTQPEDCNQVDVPWSVGVVPNATTPDAVSDVSLAMDLSTETPHIASIVTRSGFATPPWIVYRTKSGTSWPASAETVLPWTGSDPFHEVGQVQMSRDTLGMLHVAWVEDPAGSTSGSTRIRIAHRTGPPANPWVIESPAVYVASNNVGISQMHMTYSGVTAHVAYTRMSAGTAVHCWYLKKTGASWGAQTLIAIAAGDPLAMAVSRGGAAHVAYRTNGDGYLNHATVGTFPATKLRPMSSNLVLGRSLSIRVDQDNSGYPHIAYWSVNQDSLRYASKSGTGWNYQRVHYAQSILTYDEPVSIGVAKFAGSIRPRIAFVADHGESGFGPRQIAFAEGIASLSGNLGAAPALEPDALMPAVDDGYTLRIGSLPSGRIQLRYSAPVEDAVRLELFDVGGRRVREQRLFAERGTARQLDWSLRGAPPGVYVIRMSWSTGISRSARGVVLP